MSYPHERAAYPDADTLNLQVNLDGSGYLFCGRAGEKADEEKYFLPTIVEGNVTRFLAMFSRIYGQRLLLWDG